MIQSRLVWLVMDKPRHRFVFTTQQHISSSDNNNIRAAHWADHQLKAEWVGNLTRLRTFIPDNGIQLTGMNLSRTAWVGLNRLNTGVGCFRSILHK